MNEQQREALGALAAILDHAHDRSDDHEKTLLEGAHHHVRTYILNSTPQWQPIETAPKGGAHVLLWRPSWNWPRSGKFSAGAWWTNGEACGLEPTHWMPLPAAPTPEDTNHGDG